MDKMKQLYEKVAGDSALQAKFNAILNRRRESGRSSDGRKAGCVCKGSRV